MRHSWLRHIGTPHEGSTPHSGRYAWGSGENGFQRATDLYSAYRKLKNQGLSDSQIADGWGISIAKLRSAVTVGKAEQTKINMARALELKEKGWTNTRIAEEFETTEGTVRNLLKRAEQNQNHIIFETADALRKAVEEKGYIDVGFGVESYLGMSKTQLQASLAILESEGYLLTNVKFQQLMTSNKTDVLVLAPPGTSWADVQNNQDKISLVPGFYIDKDTGNAIGIEKPLDISSDRIMVNFGDQGGKDKDGVIEIRRDVADLDMGDALYCQARIAVDGTHYLKGMVMYADDLPDGIDIRFNTNKNTGTPIMSSDPKAEQVFKPMENDPDNPFGATVRQIIDPETKEVTSAINIVRAEGEWSTWDKNLSTQFLSKQPVELIKKQLGLSYDIRKEELADILSVTEPTVRQFLLDKYADQMDSDAVHLDAAAMPRQTWSVILPSTTVAENEIYDPNHRDGETVVLIRYPHAGQFEIPQLTVNNKNQEALKLVPQASDAVVINPKVAERLSGADFDGDTVVVIPNNEGRVKTKAALKNLENFDPKMYKMSQDSNGNYPYEMSDHVKGIEMGKVSNLITDMTIQGATLDEIERAVKHSMVVIDAKKHHLDYKKSKIDNNIEELQEKYQMNPETGKSGGASTLISRSTSEERVPLRTEKAVSKMTPEEKAAYDRGEKVWDYENVKDSDKYYTKVTRDSEGNITKTETAERTEKSTKGYEAKDAYTLSSGTIVEAQYADYANKVKALANEARKASRTTQATEYSQSAAKTYSEEVSSLTSKLNEAKKNAPLERAAQLIANKVVALKKESNPELKTKEKADDLKKIKGQALKVARDRVGAKKKNVLINITAREWEAIQAGAVHKTTLKSILANTDLAVVRQYATPRTTSGLSPAKLSRAKSMKNQGYTQADIADALGVSVSTLSRALN